MALTTLLKTATKIFTQICMNIEIRILFSIFSNWRLIIDIGVKKVFYFTQEVQCCACQMKLFIPKGHTLFLKQFFCFLRLTQLVRNQGKAKKDYEKSLLSYKGKRMNFSVGPFQFPLDFPIEIVIWLRDEKRFWLFEISSWFIWWML